MRVTAVVVSWNGADQLSDCLDALLAMEVRGPVTSCDVVVVDNASIDATPAILAGFTAATDRVRVIQNDDNRGFAGAANQGIAATDADAVLIANFDVTPAPDYLVHAVGALAADDARGAVQGRLHRTVAAPDGTPLVDTTGHLAFATRLFRNRGEAEPDRGQWNAAEEVFGVSGALALYRRDMLEDVALDVADRRGRHLRREVFDEDLFAYWEDVDLDWRAAMRGWVTWYEPAAVAVHERGGAGPRRTPFVEALNWRNRLLVLCKDDDVRTWGPAALLGLVVTTVLKTLEMAITVPSALPQAARVVVLVPRMLRKRPAVHDRATVASREVVDRWFGPFDFVAWVRTWWRRTRRR